MSGKLNNPESTNERINENKLRETRRLMMDDLETTMLKGKIS